MMFVMVNFHCASIDMRLECVKGVGEWGKRVSHECTSPRKASGWVEKPVKGDLVTRKSVPELLRTGKRFTELPPL